MKKAEIESPFEFFTSGNSRHGFYIDPHENLFCYGCNSSGQCAVGHTDDIVRPSKVTFFNKKNLKIRWIDVGATQSVFVFTNGSTYIAGKHEHLGAIFKSRPLTRHPSHCASEVLYPSGCENSFVKCFCGYNAVFLLDNAGAAYATGSNSDGELGLRKDQNADLLHRVKEHSDGLMDKVLSVSSGGHSTFFITLKYEVYSCGANSWAILGLYSGKIGERPNSRKKVYTPILVSFFAPSLRKTLKIAVGFKHALFLVREDSQLCVYSSGSNEDGQLGTGRENLISASAAPQKISAIRNPTNVFTGYHHSIVVSRDVIYGFGFNRNYEIGRCEKQNGFNEAAVVAYTAPESLIYPPGLDRNDFCRIEAGGNETFLFTRDGQVFGTGYSGSGFWDNEEVKGRNGSTTIGKCLCKVNVRRRVGRGNVSERFGFFVKMYTGKILFIVNNNL